MHKIFIAIVVLFSSGCYSFKDVSIPPEVKTARVNYIENRAPYVNPQLSPQLTERLMKKINKQTRLTLVQGEDANYDISAEIRNYAVSTAGISDQQSASNRLTVTVHIKFVNRLDQKANFEADVSRNFDFSANLSLQQAEAQQSDEMLKNLADEIFNRLFSNW